MAIDRSVEEADLRKVRQFQRSFAPFASRLSESGSGADGQQRGNNREFRAHAACKPRSSGEPGAHK